MQQQQTSIYAIPCILNQEITLRGEELLVPFRFTSYVSYNEHKPAVKRAKEYISKVLRELKITHVEFYSKTRTPDLVAARVIVCRTIVLQGNLTLAQLGEIIQRDHSSIIHYKYRYKPSNIFFKYQKLVKTINY